MCPTGYVCSISSSQVNGKHYTCTGTTAHPSNLAKSGIIVHIKFLSKLSYLFPRVLLIEHFDLFNLLIVSSAPCDAIPSRCQVGYKCENTEDATNDYVTCTCNYISQQSLQRHQKSKIMIENKSHVSRDPGFAFSLKTSVTINFAQKYNLCGQPLKFLLFLY